MYNIIYAPVSSTLSSHGIMKLMISFALFPHTCLSLHVIAFSFSYLAYSYCCYIAPPYVCYWHLYSDLLLSTRHACFCVNGCTVVGSWKWCRPRWNSLIVNMATVRNFCDVQGKLKLFVICRPASGKKSVNCASIIIYVLLATPWIVDSSKFVRRNAGVVKCLSVFGELSYCRFSYWGCSIKTAYVCCVELLLVIQNSMRETIHIYSLQSRLCRNIGTFCELFKGAAVTRGKNRVTSVLCIAFWFAWLLKNSRCRRELNCD
jgi:hypothetical protein